MRSAERTEQARDTRARGWVYAFSVYEAKKKATRPGGPVDDVKEFDGYAANPKHTK